MWRRLTVAMLLQSRRMRPRVSGCAKRGLPGLRRFVPSVVRGLLLLLFPRRPRVLGLFGWHGLRMFPGRLLPLFPRRPRLMVLRSRRFVRRGR